MAHITDNNSFQGLASSRATNETALSVPKSDTIVDPVLSDNDKAADSSWTLQSSNKTRRLVPQVSLTRQNLGTENNIKNKTPVVEPSKKKVTRFTKDELLNLRRPSSELLPSMASLLEFISFDPNDPVCTTPLEQEEVVRIWNASNRDKENSAANAARVKVRRPRPGDESGGGERGTDNKGDLWDDGPTTTTGDLANLSAASLQFRSTVKDIGGEGEELERKPEDTMEALFEEQRAALDTVQPNNAEEIQLDEITFGSKEPQSLASKNQSSNIGTLAQASPHLSALEMLYTDSTVLGSNSNNSNAFSTLGGSEFNSDPFLRAIPLPVPININEVEWFYTDPKQQVQGPFSQEIMRLWNEEGYFTADLPIKIRGWSKFYIFRLVFPDPRQAFLFLPQEPVPQPIHPPTFGLRHIQIHHGGVTSQQSLQQPLQSNLAQPNGVYLHELGGVSHHSILPLGVRSTIPIAQPVGPTVPATPAYAGPFSGGLGLGLGVSDLNSGIANEKSLLLPISNLLSETNNTINLQSSATVSTPVQAPASVVENVVPTNPVVSNGISKSDFAKQLLGIKGTDTKGALFKPQEPIEQAAVVVPEASVQVVEERNNIKATEKVEHVQQKVQKSSITLHENVTETTTSSTTLHKIPLVEKIVKEQQQQQSQQAAVQQTATAKLPAQQPIKTWNTNTAKAKVSLASIQKQEEDERFRKDASETLTQPTSNTTLSGSNATNSLSTNASQPANVLSVQLKSVLGLKSPSTQPTPAPWTATAAESNTAGLSLKEIMQLEAESQELERKQKAERLQSSGAIGNSWAAKARTGVPVSAAEFAPVGPTAVISTTPSSITAATPPPIPPASSTAVPASTSKSQSAPTTTSNKKSNHNIDNFGGKQMSKEMADWCSSQLKKIKSDSEDLTLMQFCMSLESAVEVREVLSQYLGSSVQVTNFATEFIKFKEEGKRPASLVSVDKSSLGTNSSTPSYSASSNLSSTSSSNATGFISASKKKKPSK